MKDLRDLKDWTIHVKITTSRTRVRAQDRSRAVDRRLRGRAAGAAASGVRARPIPYWCTPPALLEMVSRQRNLLKKRFTITYMIFYYY